jgi:hypothetical protein
MNKFEAKTIPLNQLALDTENPRFITPPNATEQDIINYLLEYEEVEELAQSINKNRGLYAGERVIVYKDGNKYVVLEGNRRISACKILTDKKLLANKRPYSAANLIVFQDTLDNISDIQVDIMRSRTDAQSSLAAKHIDGIRRWSPISKQKFFSKEFSAGKSVEEIQDTTGTSKNIIIKGIKEYNLVNYALNLEEWQKNEQNTIIDIHKLKISPFIRVFTSSPRNSSYSTLSQILKLSFSKEYIPVTSIDINIFNHCIYLVAKASFDKTIPFDTRSTLEDVPNLVEYLTIEGLLTAKVDSEQPTTTGTRVDNDAEKLHQQSNPAKNELSGTTSVNTAPTIEKATIINKALTSSRNTLIPPTFGVQTSSIKINNIILELKQLNLNMNINSAAVLLRVLIELSSKYYLYNNNAGDLVKEKDLKQLVNNAVTHMRNSKLISDNMHSNITKIGNKEMAFDIFNGYVHYDGILPIKSELIGYFDNYCTFIEKCLL